MEEKNCKIISCEIELPYNENLESILARIDGWDVEFWDKKKSGILKIELTQKK